MRSARLTLSMSWACGLALLLVGPIRGDDAPPLADCSTLADLNLDAAAQEPLDVLIQCHRSLSHALECNDQLHPKEECTKKFEQGLDRKALRRLNVATANDERALRRQANELTKANETRKQLESNLSTDTRTGNEGDSVANDKSGRDEQKDDLSGQMVSAQADLNRIKATVAYSENKLFVNSEDYEDYFFRLNTGYEFVAIDKLFSSGSPRISLLVNSKVFGEDVNDRIVGPHFYGIRFNVAASLSSSAEVTPEFPNADTSLRSKASDPAGSEDTTAADVKKSLEVELQVVVPLIRTRLFSPNNLRSYYSLIATVGSLKTDAVSQAVKRYYAGVRLSINPELYSEFLVGRTETVKSLRLEYRGQLPVYTLTNGDRIFLGTIINLGLQHKEENESDAYRVYVSWNTDLKKLFSNG